MLSFDPALPNPFPQASGQYTHLGLLGVELLFMLSGFVILMSAERARSAGSFLLGREARLHPAYLVSVVAAATAVLALDGPSRQLAVRAAANLTMLQRFASVGDLVTPYWTLAYELWFYLGVAAIVRLRLLPHVTALCLAWLAVFLPLHLLERAGLVGLSDRLHLLTS